MHYTGLDDTQLLKLLQEGDEGAFAEVYNRYWKRVNTVALNFIKSPEAAQDAVQDVFIKIWNSRENLLHVRELKPYLFVTARNQIISSLRNKVFHISLDAEEGVEEETFLPEKQLSYKESVALLQKAIELLPPQQQRAYQLSRDGGLRYEDIAQEMGISRLTVRTHISKAIQFIRQYLTDHEVNPVFLLIFLFWKAP